jgi:hypothetical protein
MRECGSHTKLPSSRPSTNSVVAPPGRRTSAAAAPTGDAEGQGIQQSLPMLEGQKAREGHRKISKA